MGGLPASVVLRSLAVGDDLAFEHHRAPQYVREVLRYVLFSKFVRTLSSLLRFKHADSEHFAIADVYEIVGNEPRLALKDRHNAVLRMLDGRVLTVFDNDVPANRSVHPILQLLARARHNMHCGRHADDAILLKPHKLLGDKVARTFERAGARFAEQFLKR